MACVIGVHNRRWTYATVLLRHGEGAAVTFANMRHLVIKHFGPISEAEIDLQRLTLLIGPQSSGKSTVLKVACFCDWIERQIEITQDLDRYCSTPVFLEHLIEFHKLEGYLQKDTYIAYESNALVFIYDGKCRACWKKGRWNYKRRKISYIPAERNLVAAIPNWYQVSMDSNNILDFMTEWAFARKSFTRAERIIGLPFLYKYNASDMSDKIVMQDGAELDLVNASSGLQALTPLFVMIKYLTGGFFKEKHSKVEDSMLRSNLEKVVGNQMGFGAPVMQRKVVDSIMKYHRSDLFIEEPEAHLFPSTQKDFVYSLVENLNASNGKRHTCVISTHSPYLMTAFNNLIQAGETAALSKEKKMRVRERFPARRMLRYREVAAYSLHEGHAVSIMDDDFRLISAEALDGASNEISDDFNFLLGV